VVAAAKRALVVVVLAVVVVVVVGADAVGRAAVALAGGRLGEKVQPFRWSRAGMISLGRLDLH